MILLTILLEIILFGFMFLFFWLSVENYDHEILFGVLAIVILIYFFGQSKSKNSE